MVSKNDIIAYFLKDLQQGNFSEEEFYSFVQKAFDLVDSSIAYQFGFSKSMNWLNNRGVPTKSVRPYVYARLEDMLLIGLARVANQKAKSTFLEKVMQ